MNRVGADEDRAGVGDAVAGVPGTSRVGHAIGADLVSVQLDAKPVGDLVAGLTPALATAAGEEFEASPKRSIVEIGSPSRTSDTCGARDPGRRWGARILK